MFIVVLLVVPDVVILAVGVLVAFRLLLVVFVLVDVVVVGHRVFLILRADHDLNYKFK